VKIVTKYFIYLKNIKVVWESDGNFEKAQDMWPPLRKQYHTFQKHFIKIINTFNNVPILRSIIQETSKEAAKELTVENVYVF
jgi:hypothetical protein